MASDTDKHRKRDPNSWPAAAIAKLDDILVETRASAGPAASATFDRADRHMTAIEFVKFWNGTKVKAMATTSPRGTPHIAPIHASFEMGRLRTTIYVNAVRRRDLQNNPAVALTTWGPGGAAAIINGRAHEIPDSEKDTRPGASGEERRTVGLEIEIHGIHAMKARLDLD